MRAPSNKPNPQSLTYTAVAMIGLGLLVIFMAWFGAASLDYTQGQIPYLISGGLTGVLLAVGGMNLLRVFEARKDADRLVAKLDQILVAIESGDTVVVDQDAAPQPVPRRRTTSSTG